MPEIKWGAERTRRTVRGGGMGFLAGLAVEKVIEGLTGLDVADGLLEIGGLLAGMARANRDILPDLVDKVRAMFGKPPGGLTREEWDMFCHRYPEFKETVGRYTEG